MKIYLYTTLSMLICFADIYAQTQTDEKSTSKQKVEVLRTDSNEVMIIDIDRKVKVYQQKSDKDSSISESKIIIKTVGSNGIEKEEVILLKNMDDTQINQYIDSITQRNLGSLQNKMEQSCKIKVFNLPENSEGMNWIENQEGIEWMDINNLSEFQDLQMLDANKPFLGVILDDENAQNKGIKIISIVDGSAAQSAGLQKEDVIIGLDGKSVLVLKELLLTLRDKKIGDSLSIEVIRGDETKTFVTTLKSKEDCNFNLSNTFNFKTPSCCTKEATCEHHQRTYKALSYQPGPKLGINVEELNAEIISDLKVKKGKGVLVTKVFDASTAEQVGLKVNDVIVQINETPIESIEGLLTFLSEQQIGSNFQINFIRYGKLKTVSGKFSDFDFPKFDFNN
jgi:predicted metalloprotease with PDZ domain